MMKIKIADIDLQASHNVSREQVYPSDCEGLANSMETFGQLVPIRVRRLQGDKWKLIYGFRRYTAAVILGWEEIEAVEDDKPEEMDNLTNFLENLLRQDLSFWEECRALRQTFDESMSDNDVAQTIGYSRGWVNIRRRIWRLSEENILRVQRGELAPSDVRQLLALSPEEQEAKAAMLASAKKEGKSVRERGAKSRRHPRSMKDMRRLQSQVHDTDREDWKALVKFALGELDNDELWAILGTGEGV